MKRLIVAVIMLVIAVSGYSQTDPGRAAALVGEALEMPTRKEAGKREISGTYTFVVELDGTISTVNVKDSMGFGLDEQIVKKLSQSTNWKVVEVAGKPTRVSYTLPVHVRLPRKR